MENLTITEIQLVPIHSCNGLVAFASCAINNSFYVGNIAIYTAPNRPTGHRLVFPTKKLASGKQVPCFYPFRKDVEEAVTKTIVDKYLELMESFHHTE